MRVGVIGINHKLADLTLREQLAKACQRLFSSVSTPHGDQHAFVLLSTCNRTEIYFFSDDLAETHSYLLSLLRDDIDEDSNQKLYSYFGVDCFLHLSRVTAGLDSAIVAETEIQGQVKTAYENALVYNSLPEELHYLFQKCLKIGKQVRSELPLKPGLPDLEHAILHAGCQIFDEPKKAKILCIGASEINLKVISFLKVKECQNITLCNRTSDYAQAIAYNQQLQFLDWNHMTLWPDFDWIIFGTKSSEYLLKLEHVENRRIGKKLIIDLCVPRNVEPCMGAHHEVTLLNIDQINYTLKVRKQSMLESLMRAEQIIHDSVYRQTALFYRREQNRLKLVAGA